MGILVYFLTKKNSLGPFVLLNFSPQNVKIIGKYSDKQGPSGTNHGLELHILAILAGLAVSTVSAVFAVLAVLAVSAVLAFLAVSSQEKGLAQNLTTPLVL